MITFFHFFLHTLYIDTGISPKKKWQGAVVPEMNEGFSTGKLYEGSEVRSGMA